MKFNFSSRNIAIGILLILTLVLGIVSIIIATRIGQQPDVSVADCAPGQFDSHGCCPLKGEAFCEANGMCQESNKTCESTPIPGNPPPDCKRTYANGTVTNGPGCGTLNCVKYTGPANSGTCSENRTGTVSVGPNQSASVTAACGQCAQIDCNDGGGSRVNNNTTCTPPPVNPPVNPPPAAPVCGDALCRTGELCERTTVGGSSYKLCTAADVTAGTAPTGAASPTCQIATCTVPTVNPPPVEPPPPPVSTPLPETAVISDDFDRLLVGFMMVVLGLLAYRFNLVGKMFENLNALTEDDAIRNTTLNKFLKGSRSNFEKKVEKDFNKED